MLLFYLLNAGIAVMCLDSKPFLRAENTAQCQSPSLGFVRPWVLFPAPEVLTVQCITSPEVFMAACWLLHTGMPGRPLLSTEANRKKAVDCVIKMADGQVKEKH